MERLAAEDFPLSGPRDGLPGWLSSRDSPANAGNTGWIPGSADPLEEGMAPPPVFLPGEPRGHRSQVATVHGATKSQTRLSIYTACSELC